MSNLEYWNTFSQPPPAALKRIEAGRLKGKSDINPQWRYRAMTETFGVIGFGWKFAIDKTWTEQGENGEVMAFANVSLYVKIDGEWSEPVPGTGGSTMIAKEKNGMYNNDEAFKMAITDALSTAMKMLGVAADIYMGLWDGTKYRQPVEKKAPAAKAGNGRKHDPVAEKLVAELGYETDGGIFATVNDKDGQPYSEKTVEELAHTINGIQKYLKDNPDLAEKKRDEYEMKRDAAKFYLEKTKG